MKTTVRMPKVGETAEVAVILEWLVEVGDSVREGDPLVEVETDKVDMEIPSPVSGTLIARIAEMDEELKVGAPLCIIDT